MKILFITPSPLGDTVLSTGLLADLYDKYPQASYTIATGPLGESLFEGFPGDARVITLVKQKRHGHWIKLWKKSGFTRWDIVVDMRDSILSRILFSGRKYIKRQGRADTNTHVVVQNARVVGLEDTPPSPRIWFSADQLRKAEELLPPLPSGQAYIAIGSTATFIGKAWPVKNFVSLIMAFAPPLAGVRGMQLSHGKGKDGLLLLKGVRPRFVLFGAPNEKEHVRQLHDLLAKEIDKENIIDLSGQTSPGEGAACLAQCSLFIGNDSGLMHCAAAAGIKTLGLFGPSNEKNYAPWGRNAAWIRTPETVEQLTTDSPGYHPALVKDSLMHSLKVDDVHKKLAELYQSS